MSFPELVEFIITLKKAWRIDSIALAVKEALTEEELALFKESL